MEKKLMSAPTAKIIRLDSQASITVVMGGESLKIYASESQENFDKALDALREKDWDKLYECMRPIKSFANKIPGVQVTKEGVFWNGEEINNVIATRILDFALAGLDFEPLCLFLTKLMANPSKRAIEELYKFLEHENLPITDNGNFLAYKGVRDSFYSKSSGTAKLFQGKTTEQGHIYNGIGEVIEMAREEVDDNKDRTCSYGLHAGSEKYAVNFAGRGRVVVVEINPTDVVSIPSDCNGQKLRTCKYKVIGEYNGGLSKPLYESSWKEEVKETETTVKTSQPRDSKGRFASNKTVKDQSLNKKNLSLDFKDQKLSSISFETPSSDWIKKVEWTTNGNKLEIVKNDGDTIVHNNVPYNLIRNFSNNVASGGSAGKYYNQYIKGKF